MKPLIIIAGPTACGKTDLSLRLAKKLDTQIISADSMQIYKYMDIGTAKIFDTQNVVHYAIDEVLPTENFSVADYQLCAKKYLNKIYAQKKIPILCGGTGFYINAVLHDNNFSCGQIDFALRAKLFSQSDEYLFKKLSEIDPQSVKTIHQNDRKRIVRALEFFSQTGQKFSQHNAFQKQNEIKYDTLFIILTLPRQILYEKIEARVDKMIELGLVNEVKKLLDIGCNKNLNSMQAIGYKEIIMYLDGQIDLAHAIELIKKNTRHYAKRQLTWFKHQTDGIWIDKNNFKNETEIVNYVYNLCQKKFMGCHYDL